MDATKSGLAEGGVLRDRYRIEQPLGQGSSGITYAATDQQTGQTVAIKVLSLAGLTNWKPLELFEREAKVLQHLYHPGIPEYLDYFQTDGGEAKSPAFCLVQELAAGESLAAKVEAGWRASEAEAQRIARAVLDILSYLHDLHPPIVHRDLKPQNIVLGEDGQVFLVDFGAVQSVYQDTMMPGSTVVGTYGYMAPEQFRGAACPASDLYALGGTLLFLLTHRSPADLPQTRMKLDFRSVVNISEAFADWLEDLLEPMVEDRLASATAALEALERPRDRAVDTLGLARFNPHESPLPNLSKPSQSKIQLVRGRRQLDLTVPPGGMRSEALALGGFALFWNGFIFFWTFMSAAMGAPIFFTLFSIPFWAVGLWMIYELVSGLFGRVRLEIDGSRYRFQQQLLGWIREVEGPVSDLYQAELQVRYSQNSRPVRCVALTAGPKTHQFGTMLSEHEKAWLVQELSAFLRERRG